LRVLVNQRVLCPFGVEGRVDGGLYKRNLQDQIWVSFRGLLPGNNSGVYKTRTLPIHPMITLHPKLKFGNRIISNKSDISLFSSSLKGHIHLK
jgi:hypothetical protein